MNNEGGLSADVVPADVRRVDSPAVRKKKKRKRKEKEKGEKKKKKKRGHSQDLGQRHIERRGHGISHPHRRRLDVLERYQLKFANARP
jgi:hypothetical protein